jgi:hypothetical protein
MVEDNPKPNFPWETVKSPSIAELVGHRDESVRGELERARAQHTQPTQPAPIFPAPESKPFWQKFWHYTDHAVLGLFELLGLLFGLPFGDDLYNDKPVSNLHLVYLVIGCLFAAGGPIFPLTREISWLPIWVAPSISNAARDARVWIAVLLLFFLYGVVPDIYRRATQPISVAGAIGVMPMGTASIEEAVKQATRQIEADKDDAIKSAARAAKERDDVTKERDAALSNATRLASQLRQPPVSPSIAPQKPVSWFSDSQLFIASGGPPNGSQVHGILIMGESTATTGMKEAYLVSGLTGHKQALKANVHSVGAYFPVDKVDIPAGAPVQLDLIFDPAIPLKDFMDQWAKFRFTVVYADGTFYERDYDETYVRQKMQQVVPEAFGPRMTPRGDK